MSAFPHEAEPELCLARDPKNEASTQAPQLKIAVIGSTYARFHEDPQVPWLRESVNRLAARGHQMTVIVPSFDARGASAHSESAALPPHRYDGCAAAAILRLLKDPELRRRLGETGRLFAQTHFDWDRITTRTEALYRRALGTATVSVSATL